MGNTSFPTFRSTFHLFCGSFKTGSEAFLSYTSRFGDTCNSWHNLILSNKNQLHLKFLQNAVLQLCGPFIWTCSEIDKNDGVKRDTESDIDM